MLSMDAGIFAPMTFNYHQNNQNSLGVAGLGYASRGKAPNIRRISVPAPQNLSTMSNDIDNAGAQTPRGSSRAQLLAGLRTAPKTPTAYPGSAQEQFIENGFAELDNSRHANQYRSNSGNPVQKTARSVAVAGMRNGNVQQQTSQSYQTRSSPPQQQTSLANGSQQMCNNLSPASSVSVQASNSHEIDNESKIYADLLAQNIYLAQQQQILQQQLRNVHQAQQLQQVQQQFQQVTMQSPVSATFANSPMSPGFYMQNTHNAQNAGYYSAYNPLTGQYNYYLAPTQQPHPHIAPPVQITKADDQPFVHMEQDTQFNKSVLRRSPSPPKDVEAPKDKGPSPPPFRRGHKKSSSLSSCVNADTLTVVDSGLKSSKGSQLPSTPMNSTFGGKGDHPTRQPRGPPSLEEIKAKPTTKHEGSKNFATRQRRRAVFKLVSAGLERRRPRSMTPLSEHEISINFEDADSVSSSQSGRHSSQSMHGDGDYSASSVSGDEGLSTKTVEVRSTDSKEPSMLRATRPGLNAYEKRRSAMF